MDPKQGIWYLNVTSMQISNVVGVIRLELGLWFWYNLEVQMGSLLILAQFLKQLVSPSVLNYAVEL